MKLNEDKINDFDKWLLLVSKQIVEQRLKQVKEGKVFSSKEVREKLFGDKK